MVYIWFEQLVTYLGQNNATELSLDLWVGGICRERSEITLCILLLLQFLCMQFLHTTPKIFVELGQLLETVPHPVPLSLGPGLGPNNPRK